MNKRLPIFLGIVLTLFALWSLVTPVKVVRSLINNLDNIGYDLQLRTRVLTEKKPKLAPIAVIDIDDRSLKAEGHWPWSRSKIAALVDELQKQGAAVIAFDIFFSEKQANIADELIQKLKQRQLASSALTQAITPHLALFDEDQTLAASLKSIQSVMATAFLPKPEKSNLLSPPLLTLTSKDKALHLINASGYISNIPVIQEAAQHSGFINIFADSDGIMRRAPLLMTYNDGVYPSLALQAVLLFLNESVQLITPLYGDHPKLEGLQIGDRVIRTDALSQVLIPFVGKSYTFPFYSATDVLQHRLPEDAVFGKIVFIGASATGLGDLHPTAIENPFPGVEIQASLANGILEENFSYKPEWTMGAALFFTAVFGLLGSLLFPYCGPRTLSGVMVLFPVVILFANNWIWEQYGLVLSFLIPILLILVLAVFNMVYGYLFETRRREQLKAIFGQYVPAKHIDQMLKTNQKNFALEGENREMSVLFADIRSFTTISEGLTATHLVEMLNTFFTPMTEIIFNHKGTIDKYVGDLIMAFWGAPLKDRHHARNAIESALSMQKKVKELESVLKEHNWPAIHIGIGVNSGVMCVGDMGSRFRRNYTVLGDSVNLASRIEGLTKYYGVDIMVSEATQNDQKGFVFRKLDYVQVKGKHEGVGIYEVICRKKELTEALEKELEMYHQGLQFYFQKNWDEAEMRMSELNKQYPERKIYSIYLERIPSLRMQSLPEDWNGVFVHHSK